MRNLLIQLARHPSARVKNRTAGELVFHVGDTPRYVPPKGTLTLLAKDRAAIAQSTGLIRHLSLGNLAVTKRTSTR